MVRKVYKSCLFFFHRFSLQVFGVRAARFADKVKQPAVRLA